MAHLKLIAATVIALFAIVLEAEQEKTLMAISEQLWKRMGEDLSPEDQANSTKAYLFAKEYIGKLRGSDAQKAHALSNALERIFNHPDRCDELSLGYIATLYKCYPQNFESARSLTEEIKKYASECLTKDYITDKIKPLLPPPPRGGACFLTSCSTLKSDGLEFIHEKFIDEQFISDYWSDNREDWPMEKIRASKAAKAVAKAIIRKRKNNIKGLKTEDRVHAYLNKRLYKPCIKYSLVFQDLMTLILRASGMLEGGESELVSSLEKTEQNLFFRYGLCSDVFYLLRIRHQTIDGDVLSALKSLPTSES